MREKVAVSFGALSPPLYQQLGLPRRRLSYMQTCADGIVHLSVGHLLSEAETRRVRKRLLKRIADTFFKGTPR